MDNPDVKGLLPAFRDGTEDNDDPMFCEALKRLKSDPGLETWFHEEQNFDAVMVAMFRKVPPTQRSMESNDGV